jgi:hypothetical protein
MRTRVALCILAALLLTVLGALPWGMQITAQNGPKWAQYAIQGLFVIGWPSTLIAGVFGRIGWVDGLGPYFAVWALSITFWFCVVFGIVALVRRRARGLA